MILDKMPALKSKMETIFSSVFMRKVYGSVTRQFLINVDYGQSIEDAVLKGVINGDVSVIHSKQVDEEKRLKGGSNTLLYGVPGSGKSWTIDHEYCGTNSIVKRLVFHPDYTNADFIGQILPKVNKDEQVTYEFAPGPFTLIMRDAYVNPQSEYILVIEEINRGNAPAIFGEVFQLLDRMTEDDESSGLAKGTSEYGITNKYMANYIYENSERCVRIPSNLSIIGTMNSSDQNVFTLDTAFQRRWNLRLIENSFETVRPSLAQAKILDTGITWKHFCETINDIIVRNKGNMVSAEDKRLGVYFIHESEISYDDGADPTPDYSLISEEYNALIELESRNELSNNQIERLISIRKAFVHNRVFPEKVIKYLWDDAFKYNPEVLFDTNNMDSLERVIRTFIHSKETERLQIFNEAVRSLLLSE